MQGSGRRGGSVARPLTRAHGVCVMCDIMKSRMSKPRIFTGSSDEQAKLLRAIAARQRRLRGGLFGAALDLKEVLRLQEPAVLGFETAGVVDAMAGELSRIVVGRNHS